MPSAEETVFALIREIRPKAAETLSRSCQLWEDLQLSSLDFAELVFGLENAFRIRIDFNAQRASSFQTVDEVVCALEELLAQERAQP